MMGLFSVQGKKNWQTNIQHLYSHKMSDSRLDTTVFTCCYMFALEDNRTSIYRSFERSRTKTRGGKFHSLKDPLSIYLISFFGGVLAILLFFLGHQNHGRSFTV